MINPKLILILTYILSFTLLVSQIYSQNLITNPGFENGMTGWQEIWTRDANKGTSQVIYSQSYTGNNSLKLLHWGVNDYSFQPIGYRPVKAGEIYDFSAWVNVVKLKNRGELSIALFKSNKEAVNWIYEAVQLKKTNGQFEKFKTTFIIPDGVSFIWTRFVGYDSTEIYIDDCELIKTGDIGKSQNHSLQNEYMSVIINTPSFAMDIHTKSDGKNYTSQLTSLFTISSVDSTASSFTFKSKLISENADFDIKISLIDRAINFEILGDPNAEIKHEFGFPGAINSKAGEFLVIPRATGMLLPVEESYPFYNFNFFEWKSTMSFIGATNLSSGYVLISDNPWDTGVEFVKTQLNILTAPRLTHYPSKSKLGYNRNFQFHFFDTGGYKEMTNLYRNYAKHKGYIKTFEEKITENPNMEKLLGAVNFYAINWSFQNTNFIDSLYNYGIDRAIINYGGEWSNQSLIPQLANKANSLGLISSRYDAFTDVWEPGVHPEEKYLHREGYPEDIIIEQNGSFLEGWNALMQNGEMFQGYYLCSLTHSRHANNRLSTDLARVNYTGRFIDVELASKLTECYSVVHPATRYQDAMGRIDLLNTVKNVFNLVAGSEEARDFAFPVVDYGEGTMTISPDSRSGYDWSAPVYDIEENYIKYNMSAERRIPLHGLIYHNVHVPTWYTGDGLSKVPEYWDEKDLFNILYASMPLILPPDQNYWNVNRERFISSANLVSAVFRNCGFAKMTDHQFLSSDRKVQKTDYDNGWSVCANFRNSDFTYVGEVIPSEGFYATNGEEFVFRKKYEGNTIAVALLKERIFINPMGKDITFSGIRSYGSTLIKKYDNYLVVSFIGDQNFVDININEIPWKMKNVKLEGLTNNVQYNYTSLDNGWIRILKKDNQRFYKISGDFSSDIIDDKALITSYSLEQNYPNPFNPTTSINYTIPKGGNVRLEIYNSLGEVVNILKDSYEDAGNYTITWTGKDSNGNSLSSGIYFYRLIINGFTQVRKMILLK